MGWVEVEVEVEVEVVVVQVVGLGVASRSICASPLCSKECRRLWGSTTHCGESATIHHPPSHHHHLHHRRHRPTWG